MRKFFLLLKNYNLKTLIEAGLLELHRKIWREMFKGSYSQNYEDLIIDTILKKEKGKFLEIGGYHPIRLSNTYYFYKKGWRGTVVEPNSEVKKMFTDIRPEDKFINAGVSNKNEVASYYQFLIPALNTFSKNEAEANIKKGHKLLSTKKIKLRAIADLVNKEIDLLSLDTEGFDRIILEKWPWKKVKPKVICVENDPGKVLIRNGYQLVCKTRDNLIYTLVN